MGEPIEHFRRNAVALSFGNRGLAFEMAELIVDLSRLRHNLQVVQGFCARQGLELMAVAKGCNGFPPLIEVFQEHAVGVVGFSRIADASMAAPFLAGRPCFISIPAPTQAEAVARHFGASLHSELVTIRAMARAAEQLSLVHGIILMVDIGDLREGVVPEALVGTVRSILEVKNPFITLCGVGATMGCCSGTLPDEQNLGLLQELVVETERQAGYPIKTVSVGGSVFLPLLEHGLLPSRVNQVRIGEAILLGNIPTLDQKHPALLQDAFILRGTVLEAKEKPSKPPGRQGKDVFGQLPTCIDRGPRFRCLLDFGIIDTYPKGLSPLLKGLDFVNSNSDYTIVDATEADCNLKPGDTVDFTLNYQALIRAFHANHLGISVVESRRVSRNTR